MMTCTVVIGSRRFLVTADTTGEPIIVKERKVHMPGTHHECLYNAPYWHHKHHGKGRPGSLIAEILAEARKKLQ